MPRKSHKNKNYSPDLCLKAVENYLSRKGIMKQIQEKYVILSDRHLRD